ncbi:unnamed protein product [Spirodela intermedia]|uniref:Uncharacterized protein n=1 Tax=Spirodela intermedia TaxID=51605 RepID=A0A7I8JCR9_SPIIN|nr:unnamed protein product [Spirodela intermedia]CAA6667525.1 unnamed protein product [Spirodela intermedia]
MAEANAGDKGNRSAATAAEEEKKTESGFKLNAEAPEFVPNNSHSPTVPVAGVFHPWYGFFAGDGLLGTDWFHFIGQEPLHVFSDAAIPSSPDSSSDALHKIVKQVEYQLSNANLSANDSLVKLMSKDPEGYVPLSALTSSKKVKSLGSDHQKLATALRSSSRLVVSQDGSKVRRRQAFTERDKEELQARTVVVENLPEDHSRKNLEKIFRVAGSIKNIKVCRPQEPSAVRSLKGDFVISNKLHALVEYETVDQAERAVERLNDEGNWRKGLRVRIMLRRTPRSVIRGRRTECDPFDVNSEDEETHQSSEPASGTSQPQTGHSIDQNPAAGRRRRPGHPVAVPSAAAAAVAGGSAQGETSGKSSPRGPRMPDGTRGFSWAAGSPWAPLAAAPRERTASCRHLRAAMEGGNKLPQLARISTFFYFLNNISCLELYTC